MTLSASLLAVAIASAVAGTLYGLGGLRLVSYGLAVAAVAAIGLGACSVGVAVWRRRMR